MAAGKAKTTFAKMDRERKMREKRMAKEARKIQRQNGPADQHLRPHDLLMVQPFDPDAPDELGNLEEIETETEAGHPS